MSKPNRKTPGIKLITGIRLIIPALIVLFQTGCEKENTPESSIVINEVMPVDRVA
jgi:hypothetical protein